MIDPRPKSMSVSDRSIELDEKREYPVSQSNVLIQQSIFSPAHAGSSLSLLEHKVLLYLISQIKPTNKDLEMQFFDIKEFCTVIGIKYSDGDTYKRVKEAITQLASRVMWLQTTKGEVTVRWIERALLEKGSGIVGIKLDYMLAPYLLNLRENFTKYPFINVIRMKTRYGLTIYQLLKSYAWAHSELRYNVEDLKQLLDCTNYRDFNNFKKRVIEPAINDINKYTDISVSVSYQKTGRAYTHVIFTFVDLTKEDSQEYYTRRLLTEAEIEDQIGMI